MQQKDCTSANTPFSLNFHTNHNIMINIWSSIILFVKNETYSNEIVLLKFIQDLQYSLNLLIFMWDFTGVNKTTSNFLLYHQTGSFIVDRWVDKSVQLVSVTIPLADSLLLLILQATNAVQWNEMKYFAVVAFHIVEVVQVWLKNIAGVYILKAFLIDQIFKKYDWIYKTDSNLLLSIFFWITFFGSKSHGISIVDSIYKIYNGVFCFFCVFLNYRFDARSLCRRKCDIILTISFRCFA